MDRGRIYRNTFRGRGINEMTDKQGAIIRTRLLLQEAHDVVVFHDENLANELQTGIERLDNEIINAVPDKMDKYITQCDNTYPFTLDKYCATVLEAAKILNEGLKECK